MLSWEFKLTWGENCSKNRKIRSKVDSRIHTWEMEAPGDGLLLRPSSDAELFMSQIWTDPS